MNIEQFREFCLQLPAVTEETPFGPDTLVFKVKNKMFALCGIDNFDGINLKCNPEKAIQLREEYPQIIPGYHMNKTHWNTVNVDGLNKQFIEELILHSYDLVKSSLPKKVQQEIELGI
jgi:predicted DNA-binding protein (MmcQ/YjbR family)